MHASLPAAERARSLPRARHGGCSSDILMTLETVLLWAFVGLISGWLASKVAGSALGMVVDIAGAFVGGLLFRELHVSTPFSGLLGTIFVAFIGALALLIVLRIVRRL